MLDIFVVPLQLLALQNCVTIHEQIFAKKNLYENIILQIIFIISVLFIKQLIRANDH